MNVPIDCKNICSIDGIPNYEEDRRTELANCQEIQREFSPESLEIFKKNKDYAEATLKGICNSKKKRPTINEGRYEDESNKYHWDFNKEKNGWEKSKLWEGGSTNKKRRKRRRNTKKKNRRSNKKK